MVLGAVSFADPVMLVGLLAAGVPVLLHLLNRIRSPVVAFPTLRFLKITAQKTARRRRLQQWLLLLLRMVVFGAIAAAVAGPFIGGGSAGLAYGFMALGLAGLFLVTAGAGMAADAAGSRQAVGDEAQGVAGRVPAGRWAMAGSLALLGVAAAGWAGYGLMSNRYFDPSRGAYTGRSTAAVIVLDNSHSMLARRDSLSAWQRGREQVRQLLTGPVKPAQAALLVTNPGENPPSEGFTSDYGAMLGQLEKVEAGGRARGMKGLVRQAVGMLRNSGEADRMLVVVSDFARAAFADAEVLSAVKEMGEGGTFRVVLMPQGGATAPADVGIAELAIVQGQAVVGSELVLEATLVNSGDAATIADLKLLRNGKEVPGVTPRVQLSAGGGGGVGSGRSTVKVACAMEEAGWHRYTLELVHGGDALAWNDKREVVVNVAPERAVLVIGPEEAVRARSTAHFVTVALNPFGPGEKWAIRPVHKSAAAAEGMALGGYGAVFVCDVPRVSAGLAKALEGYAKGGGRVVLVLGPSVDAGAYNRELGSRGMLAGELGEPVVTASGSVVDWVDVDADVFANLFDTQEPFRSVVVTGRWSVRLAGRGRVLSKLADDAVFVTQHAVGSGAVYAVYSAPGGGWSNMATSVAFLPMVNRMALGDAGRGREGESYEPGRLVEIPVGVADGSVAVDVTRPDGGTVNVRPLVTPGQLPRWDFGATLQEGVYGWRSVDGKRAGQFVVNPPGDEAELVAADVEALAAETGVATLVAPTVGALQAELDKQAEGTSLAPGVLALVLMLTVFEALLANRYRPAARVVGEAGEGQRGGRVQEENAEADAALQALAAR